MGYIYLLSVQRPSFVPLGQTPVPPSPCALPLLPHALSPNLSLIPCSLHLCVEHLVLEVLHILFFSVTAAHRPVTSPGDLLTHQPKY